MSLRILYHHRTQGKGVEKVHILSTVNAWRASGHSVHIVSPPGVSLCQSEDPEINDDKEIRWKRVAKYIPEFGFELFELAYNLWAYISLSDNLRRKVYGLVFERYSFLCIAGVLAAKRHAVPFFLEVNYTSRTPIVRKRTRLVKLLERLIERILFNKADGIIVVSTYLKKHLMSLGVSGEKCIVIPNAADPSIFHPDLTADDLRTKLTLHNKKVVGFVGYFYPWHGIQFLLETFPFVKRHVKNVIYLLVGDGPIHDKISEMIRHKQLEDQILLVGAVPHDEIRQYMALFDIAVMPGSNMYGSPMKIPEYMAMGKPVIAPRLSPIQDIIDDGNTGLLFEPDNREQLIRKIEKLLKDDELRNSLGSGARMSVVNCRNWKKNSERILDLYNGLIKASQIQDYL